VGDIVDDLDAEGSPLSRRAARYIRIKRNTEEQMRAQHKRDLKRLYERGADVPAPQHSGSIGDDHAR
jgi:hypothetical protein